MFCNIAPPAHIRLQHLFFFAGVGKKSSWSDQYQVAVYLCIKIFLTELIDKK